MVRIENWAVVFSSNSQYTPPDQRQRSLYGNVYGHPSFEEGFAVTTSSIVGGSRKTQEGHVVSTASREYLLGEPSESYLAWLKEEGIDFDPEQPIKFVD
jgi:hypothetical protein